MALTRRQFFQKFKKPIQYGGGLVAVAGLAGIARQGYKSGWFQTPQIKKSLYDGSIQLDDGSSVNVSYDHLTGSNDNGLLVVKDAKGMPSKTFRNIHYQSDQRLEGILVSEGTKTEKFELGYVSGAYFDAEPVLKYTDTNGKRYSSDTHDPIEGALMQMAMQRFRKLEGDYKLILGKVQERVGDRLLKS